MRRTAVALIALSLLAAAPSAASAGLAEDPPARPASPKVVDDRDDVKLMPNQGDEGTPSDYAIDIKRLKVNYTETRFKAWVSFHARTAEWDEVALFVNVDADTYFTIAQTQIEGESGLYDTENTLVADCPVKFKVSASKKLMRFTVASECLGSPESLASVEAAIRAFTDTDGYHMDDVELAGPIARR